MLRNDGIGGTPRLTRYTSIGTPPGGKKDHDPTPNRPPLPRRNPGETDLEHDPRFRLVGARAATPAPKPESGRLSVDHPVVRRAREIVSTHLPSRLAECRVCNSAALCEPFTKALGVLRRHDPGKARRVMAVLYLAGLWPPVALDADTGDDDADEDGDGSGDDVA
ncbi:hypothetical protein O7608_28870 [Solwaraspora sp. WMMA2056]|uniref:hypothetical protein n=1 Tax=Solwaraspora sp. WMMA2056 TaxID=3015161 RepID=UPI00259B763F|nr:hypothetical protein [Solwaraspora sp. WMMA2056]WJK40365.1 hypothetical protein O7608_28870 [Solwaraspora sp. WMMA2056]